MACAKSLNFTSPSFTACIQQQGRTLPATSSCLGAHPARQMGQGTILILMNDEESTHFYYFVVTFLFFLITCRRIFRVGHLQISCCNKGGDVTLTVLGMHADSNSAKYLFGGSRNRTEIDYIPLLVRQ